MFKKLLISLLVAVPLVAQAGWVKISEDDEYRFLIDPDRTVASSPSLQYAETWVKQVVHADKTQDGLGVGDYKMVRYKFKCNSNEYGMAASYY